MIHPALGRLAALLPLLLLAPAAGAATVSGRVLDSGGSPVRGVKVVWEKYRTDEEVLVDETKGAAPAPLGETATDSQGRFQVKLDKPDVEVAIRMIPGALAGALLTGPYDSSEDVEVDDIELPAPEKISGRVTDEAGKAVAGARVRVASGSFFEEEDVLRYAEATSGADGTFSIANAPGKSGSLLVRATGYAPSSQFSMQRSGTERITLKSGGTLTGTVLDPTGKPAEGVIVLSGSIAAKTDASGAYRLAGVPRGSQPVEALGRDDLAARNDAVRVKSGETAEVPLRLARSASVTGSVIDEKTRRPLFGVRISTSSGRFSFRRSEATTTRRVRTDAKGKFRIAGLAARRYSILASKTDYLPATMPGVVAAVSTPGTVAIALQRAAGVSGRVTDEKGAPVAGARVGFAQESSMRALVRGGPAAFLGRPGVATGPDGAFRLRGLGPERNRTLEAAKVGYVTAKRHGVTLKSGEVVKDVALILKRGLEARGRVVDPAGQPIAEASVRVSRPEGEASRFMFRIGGMEDRRKPDAWSGADGTFRVGGLEVGDYVLVVQREGYALKQVPSVNVRAAGENDWPPVVLSPGVAIAGFVRNGKGEPVVGAQVSSFAVDAGPRGTATTDPEGRFRLDGFGSDRAVMLFVTAEGYASLQRQVTPPAEDLSVVLKTTGTIRGRVEDAGSNRPVTDFSAAYRAPRTGGFGGMQIRMGGDSEKAFQSPDGTFELTEVPAGKWNVTASASGYRPAEVAGIEIGEGETKEGVVLSLKRGASVSGRVLDPRRGTGVPNASVSWSQDSGAQRPGAAMIARLAGESTAVSTDADGRYRVDGLPSGKITISAGHPDYLEASRQVEVDDEATVDLTLSLGGSIAGSVVGKDGRSAVPGAQVSLEIPDGGFGMGEESTRADAAGGFLFEHLKPGRYRVSAKSNAGGNSSKEVVLAESQRLDGVLLQMEGGASIRGTVSGLPAGKLGGVRIYASGQNYEDGTTTGDDGRFELPDVPAGVLRLYALTSFPTSRTTSKNVEVPEGAGEVPVEIVFEGSSRLAGRVTRGERPRSGIFVTAISDPPTAGDTRASTQTDDNGQYAIEGLADGNYQVLLSGGYRRNFTVSGDTNGDIDLPSVSISGVVTEAGSNDPVEGANVQAESGSETSAFTMKRAVTDSRGFYSIDDLDSASYQVTARREGYELKTQPASVGSSSVELNFQLSRGAGLAVRAVDGLTGLSLRGLQVLAYSGNRTVAFSGRISLDSEGKGEISSLGPGIYALYFFSGGYAPRSLPSVQVPSPTLLVPMTPGGRLEVRTETPVAGRIVDGGGATYLFDWWRLDGRVSAGPPATVWDNVAPGSYALITSGPSGEKSYPFSVNEGRTTTVEVR